MESQAKERSLKKLKVPSFLKKRKITGFKVYFKKIAKKAIPANVTLL